MNLPIVKAEQQIMIKYCSDLHDKFFTYHLETMFIGKCLTDMVYTKMFLPESVVQIMYGYLIKFECQTKYITFSVIFQLTRADDIGGDQKGLNPPPQSFANFKR